MITNIKFHPLHKLKKVLDKKIIEFENGSKTSYDLLILVPPHQVPRVIKNSGLLGDGDQHWINVDRFTLRTKYKNVFAIGDVTEIRLDNAITISKAGIFAEGKANAVSQQIISEIKNINKALTKFDGKGFCFMEIGSEKAGYLTADFYNKEGPTIRLEPPSKDYYIKKLEFERCRLNDWLL
jgi:sulfide:quinone oxidoreductase